ITEPGREALRGLHALECRDVRGVAGALGERLLHGRLGAALAEGMARRLIGQRPHGIAAHEPAPLTGDADGHGLEALAVNGGEHGGSAGQGHLVLTRLAAEDHADAELLRHALPTLNRWPAGRAVLVVRS